MRRFLLALLLAALAGCGGEVDNSEPPAILTSIEDPISLEINWTIDTRASSNEAAYRLRPLLDGNRVYTIDTGGMVRGVELESGSRFLTYQTDLEPITGLGGNGQLLLATSRNGDLVAYRELDRTLQIVWSIRLGSEIRATPVLEGDQVFVRSVDGRLFALSAIDGKQQWQVVRRVPALSLTGNSQPQIMDDMVIVGFDDGKLNAYDRETGSSLWETTITLSSGRTEVERLVDLDGNFAIRDGVIYVASFQGDLAAVQALSGDILWTRNFSSYQAIALDDDALYLSSDNSDLWAIDRRTGGAFWKQDALHARRVTAPALIEDKLVVADLEGYLHWLDKSDGQLLGRIRPTRERNFVQPLVWGDAIVSLDRVGILSSVQHLP